MLCIEILNYFKFGWIQEYFINPKFYFTFDGFHWLQPLSPSFMVALFFVLFLSGLLVAVGLFYRWALLVFLIGFSYLFLLDKTNYLNHFYLIILVLFLMLFIRADRAFSLRQIFFSAPRLDDLPSWNLIILRFQIGLVYVYGGIAKLNADWLQGEPIRIWIGNWQEKYAFLSSLSSELLVCFFTYGGLLFDLFIVPLLIIKRTRMLGICLVFLFHIINWQLFSIGIFPWFMMVATILFFPVEWFNRFRQRPENPDCIESKSFIYTGLLVYMLIQLLVPLRHFIYPGDPNWSEEGHRFSWHMKLRQKVSQVDIVINDLNTNKSYLVDQSSYLTERQLLKMWYKPDMIQQFAVFVAGDAQAYGIERYTVTARAYCSLNGRAPQLFLDTAVDLSRVQYGMFEAADWILPLNTPLKP